MKVSIWQIFLTEHRLLAFQTLKAEQQTNLFSDIVFLMHTTTASVSQWLFWHTVYPKKYAHGFCFAVLCCGYTLTDFPISIRLTSLALWQSNDCPSASKATLMNMDKYFMWIHYERLHNHNKAKHNKTVFIFLGIYCIYDHIIASTEDIPNIKVWTNSQYDCGTLGH